jgi:NAD(P)H-flavin reductase/ferredoxin
MTDYQVTLNGESFLARHGELLLDAALNNGINLPHDCRAGHCGTCCVRLVSGDVSGGAGSEPDIVHACQCRVVGDAVIERRQASAVCSVEGVLKTVRPLSDEVLEVGIKIDGTLPYHAGQYAKVRFSGYPGRPFSITHPVGGNPSRHLVWFHIRRMEGGRVTGALGKKINSGHRVTLDGPFGSAHFRPELAGRLILVSTNTGFAPIWSIAVAALREDPARKMMVIAGGRSIESLYMGPALARLARFRNVRVAWTCSSSSERLPASVLPGRPTDYLPRLLPSDVIYTCGAPAMVDSMKAIAGSVGATCYADPFLPNAESPVANGVLSRAMSWLAKPVAAPVGTPPVGTPAARRERERPRHLREQPGASA